MFKKNSKTEKFLVASMSVLLFILVFSIFSKDPIGASQVSARSEESKSEASSASDKSEEYEDSEKSEGYEEYEKPVNDDFLDSSDNSIQPTPVITTTNTQEVLSEDTKKTASIEMGDLSEMSKVSEKSVESIKSILGYDKTVLVDGDKAIVRKKEKLFGIFNIEIESEVTLDDAGNVIDEKKDFFNWLLAVFSF